VKCLILWMRLFYFQSLLLLCATIEKQWIVVRPENLPNHTPPGIHRNRFTITLENGRRATDYPDFNRFKWFAVDG